MINKYLMLFVVTFLLSTGTQAALISLSPSSQIVNDGDTFLIDLIGSDFNDGDLDGGGVNISFNSSVISLNSVTVDIGTWEFFSTSGTIDNGTGNVDGITFNSFQSRTGDLLFATLEFTAVDTGVSSLGLSEFSGNPFSSGGSAYPNITLDQSALVTVQAVPVPAAMWLFISGLGLLVTTQRRKFA